eukprot:1158304-Pelagomonas_calceolata.AAC.4
MLRYRNVLLVLLFLGAGFILEPASRSCICAARCYRSKRLFTDNLRFTASSPNCKWRVEYVKGYT